MWRRFLQRIRQRTWRLTEPQYHWLDCAKKRSLSHPKISRDLKRNCNMSSSYIERYQITGSEESLAISRDKKVTPPPSYLSWYYICAFGMLS
jgi:hypothetical protein